MTYEQFKKLAPGDIIRSKIDGESYTVKSNRGGDIKAIKTINPSSPDSWELIV